MFTHKLEGEQTLYMEDYLSFLEKLIREMAKAKKYSQVFRNKLKTKTPEEWAKELYAYTAYSLEGTPMRVLVAGNMTKEKLEKQIYRAVILHKDAVLKEKHIYKYSISLDRECYCKCGTQFEYNEEYDEKICPNCFNTYFRHMSRDSGPVVLSSDWIFFEDEDRIKIRAHKYVAVSWRGIISTHRADYKMVVLNIKTGRSYYLFKKKEKDRYQILSFNIWTSSSMENCPEEFVKKLFDAFNRKTNYRHQRLFDKMVFVEGPEYKNKTEYVLWLENYFVKEEWGEKEKIQVKYNSKLIQLMVVLNRNPEIDVVLEHIATICDSKLFWLVVEKILKDFPKGKLDGKPHEALSKILNTKITKPILRDYVNGVFDHKEFSLYSNLCELFGLDNAREISKAKVLRYYDRYTDMFLEKLVKDSGNKTIAKNKLLRLARTIGIGICEDIMRMNEMLVEMGEEAAEVNFSMTPDEIKNIHDNLSISLTIINNRGCEEGFRKRIPEMTKYEYTNGNYKIIAPKEIMDLNKEGHHMHHCVASASYCQSVADGTCYIFFVRDMEDNREATVEVRTENKHVVQVKAKYNKKPEDEVLDFVNEWANKFGLEFSYDCW